MLGKGFSAKAWGKLEFTVERRDERMRRQRCSYGARQRGSTGEQQCYDLAETDICSLDHTLNLLSYARSDTSRN